jgi:DNA-binding MarR family transcriptional regulator
MSALVESCAREFMEATPQFMQFFREEMRAGRNMDLSVPQFRALAWLNRHPGCGLGEVAEGMGLSDPSMSKLVDGLVRRGLVARVAGREDRRRVALSLTAAGTGLLADARRAAAQAYVQRLAGLPEAELERIAQSLRILRALFTPRAPGYRPDASPRPEAR